MIALFFINGELHYMKQSKKETTFRFRERVGKRYDDLMFDPLVQTNEIDVDAYIISYGVKGLDIIKLSIRKRLLKEV